MKKREKMTNRCIQLCNDPSVGYSQYRRLRNPDVDCSSLMYLCAAYAGYAMPAGAHDGWSGAGYTGTMLRDFTAAGFTAKRWDGDWEPLPVGTIMLNEYYHTEMIVDWHNFGGAHIDENGDIVGAQGGDQTGNEVSIVPIYEYWAGWDWALVPPENAAVPQPVPEQKPTGQEDIDRLAKEVIGGLWGNNPQRAEMLKSAGIDYRAVQQRVNEILANGNMNAGNVPPAPDLDPVAWDVIRGKYGNNPERIARLTSAGYDAVAVQERVNELLR